MAIDREATARSGVLPTAAAGGRRRDASDGPSVGERDRDRNRFVAERDGAAEAGGAVGSTRRRPFDRSMKSPVIAQRDG
jgi:hypothetical protein